MVAIILSLFQIQFFATTQLALTTDNHVTFSNTP